MAQDIVLGTGVFSIGNVDVGLTRGGGHFTVERVYKHIEADGDYGPVKGRIRKDKSTVKLTVSALELLPANLPKMYPATTLTTNAVAPITDTLTAKATVEDSDYADTVKFTGKTKAGRSVIITVSNAINLENIDWALVDKDEVVAKLTYTGTYLESTRTTEPWKIEYIDAV